jgi:hypothetical protein
MTERTRSYQREPTSPDKAIVICYDEGSLARANGAQTNALGQTGAGPGRKFVKSGLLSGADADQIVRKART